MTALNRATRRRLQQLRQVPSVWEGDRRPLTPNFALRSDMDPDEQGECILWVDGTEGLVRAMDVVPANSGPEAVVRTLLRAMEYPHSATRPARPQKIVVRDREIQFFLRGVLQDLGITVDYVPDLPLIDEIFRGLQEVGSNRPPQLPPERADALMKSAQGIWQDAPWEALDEEKILAIELNHNDVSTLYVSILGMLGMEYGLLMYRSVESLKKFRERVLETDDSPESLEGAFLDQDCFFLTFEQNDEMEEEAILHPSSRPPDLTPAFGNLHPLEGMRSVLYEEEADTVLLALDALHRFFEQHLASFKKGLFPELTGRYRLPDPRDAKKKIAVKVSTLPGLATELEHLADRPSGDDEFSFPLLPILRDDLIPRDSFYSLGAISWEILTFLRSSVKHHQSSELDFPQEGDGFPVILIQTSRPKALELIESLQTSGGLQSICFNPGEDPFNDQQFDLGILQTKNGELHLFGEFVEDDPVHVKARKKWDQRCKKTKGHCGLVIARGLKGANRGNPDLPDMLALFEVRSLSPKELGLGPLELIPQLGVEE